MVHENQDSSGGSAESFPMDPVVSPVKAIVFKPVKVSGHFYFSFFFFSKQSSS